jgi:hypothetical protein
MGHMHGALCVHMRQRDGVRPVSLSPLTDPKGRM